MTDQIWSSTKSADCGYRGSLERLKNINELAITEHDPFAKMRKFQVIPHRVKRGDILLQVGHLDHPSIRT